MTVIATSKIASDTGVENDINAPRIILVAGVAIGTALNQNDANSICMHLDAYFDESGIKEENINLEAILALRQEATENAPSPFNSDHIEEIQSAYKHQQDEKAINSNLLNEVVANQSSPVKLQPNISDTGTTQTLDQQKGARESFLADLEVNPEYIATQKEKKNNKNRQRDNDSSLTV
ncbi:hypothetical protein [Neptuniibacter sp. QD37_11]|uniref:hypothetical protein n=1 Tax=Neptuniibacter sp. QD37_11 TaxID=3398209 RepID=UPI0039F5ED9D